MGAIKHSNWHRSACMKPQTNDKVTGAMQRAHYWGPGGRARLTSWMKRCRPPSERSAFTSTATVRSTASRSQHLNTGKTERHVPQQLFEQQAQ